MKSCFWLLFAFFSFTLLVSCNSNHTLFEERPSGYTGIDFINTVVENDSINVLDMENVNNGGGVGVGDFNRDGLDDIYFTGNMVSNKLYLNKGKFKFQDITDEAGVGGNGRWSRGVTIVDINNDGLPDIYVCATLSKEAEQRKNLLYIHQGINKNGIPHFKEMASQYGLADTSHSTQAAFFDYDNDGDLDVYIANNEIRKADFASRFRPIIKDGSHFSTDRLYRNDWSDTHKHPLFTNVSNQAGILFEGYSHAVSITDINKDGWKDIYVTNDFASNDLLYINNHDGTFSEQLSAYFKHTSVNAMGNDVNDINNDGLMDVLVVDMDPEDNLRKKMMIPANSYQNYQNSDLYGYNYQYVRNTLQLNRGPRILGNDSIGPPVFSDIAYFSGIEATDWSWTPLMVDFDNDGYRDIIITNGYPKDITDRDFMTFRADAYSIASKQQMLEQIPTVKIHNYAYHNNGDLTFKNVTWDWGFETPSFSNGAAYADLDNDGDLDLVINNINDKAFVYENTMSAKNPGATHFIQIKLEGDAKNRNGIGTWIEIYYQGQKQVYEHSPYRGYLSSVQMDPHFGLGNTTKLDSVVIKWPGDKKQVLRNVKADQKLIVKYQDAKENYDWHQPVLSKSLFTEITNAAGIDYLHKELDYVDFNVQKLLPHKFSEYGPALAVGDIDGNGMDDIVAGGSLSFSAQLFLQQKSGKFIKKELLPASDTKNKKWEDLGIVLFDADSDHDLDIYITSGGFENEANSQAYQDKLYINNGKAQFRLDSMALPANYTSKSCVRAADYDKDGDLDLFLAGRVEPSKYPKPVASFIYRNDSEEGSIKFTDVTKTAANFLINIGLVSDATWTDFNNDGWQDIVLAGEWMPVTFIRNNKGLFENVTAATGIANNIGWWGSIISGDFDNDGDMDYIAGNLGLNSFYRASAQYPVSIYAKDFDNNGSYDAVPSIYLPASSEDTSRKEFPVHVRDDMIKQMIGFRSKFQNYRSYAVTTFDSMFAGDELKDALILRANNFSHCFIRNMGNNKFELSSLPSEAQYSCINGMIPDDYNEDGNLDLLVNGNDYGTEVSVGRYDACNGLLLLGDGKGGFSPASILESGVFIPGNGKALVKLRSENGSYLVAASQNKGPLKIFRFKKDIVGIPMESSDVTALLKYKNGKTQRCEIGYGSSFLSQSGRFLKLGNNISGVEIIDNKGNRRNVVIQLNSTETLSNR